MLHKLLKDKIGYNQLNLKKAFHLEFEKTQPSPTISLVNDNELIGIELEMERMPYPTACQYYWTPKKDGSLRNNGIEYVSIPMRCNQIETALTYLDTQFKLNGCNPDFNKRTSTHIHLNIRDLTVEQLLNLVVLYAVFEKHFFKFTNYDRETSLFCVPLYASRHLTTYKRVIQDIDPYWSKYLALNILPVIPNNDTSTYGTVEFRHLHGTMDPNEILQFVNSVVCLKQEAKKWTHTKLLEVIAEANSTSHYGSWYHQIFKDNTHHTMTQYDFEYCISQTKRAIFKNIYRDTLI